MSLVVRPFDLAAYEAWDAFAESTHQATFLHTRRFLSYHGDRYKDRSLILEAGGRWVGLFPAAEHPDDEGCVVSHPGITYGGILHSGRLTGDAMLTAMSEIAQHYAGHQYERLVYKAVPSFYHQIPAQDDLYALFRLGALRTRCDLSSVIDLQRRSTLSARRERSLKKAVRAGVEVREGTEFLAALWDVLIDNLQRKHGVSPAHALPEIRLLSDRFPENIRCLCGMLDDVVVAGVVVFVTPTACHAQYIAATEDGYKTSALDVVLESCIAVARREGRRWFDFGISTEKSGTLLNDGLYRFKTEFGGGGYVHEFYEMKLRGG